MAEVSTLVLRLRNRQFNRGLRESDKGTKKLTKSSNFLGKAITAIGFAYAAKKLTEFGVSAAKIAIDAEETANKFNTVFESIGTAARDMSKEFADSFGLAESNSKKLLGSTGDLLVGFGFAEKEALKLSGRVNRLAVDLASFQNLEGGASRASKALTSALLGETESAKSLGIVIRQNTKEYRDRVETLAKTQKKTIDQAKALVNLEIAYKQSTKAIGDSERTWNSAANVIRRGKEAWTDFKDAIGTVIMEFIAIDGVGNDFINNLKFITEEIKSSTNEWVFMFDSVKAAVTAMGKVLFSVGMRLAEAINTGNVKSALESLSSDFTKITNERIKSQEKAERRLRDGIQNRIKLFKLDIEARRKARLEANKEKGPNGIGAGAGGGGAGPGGVIAGTTRNVVGSFRLAGAALAGSAEAVSSIARGNRGQDVLVVNTKETAKNTKKSAENSDKMVALMSNTSFLNLDGAEPV